MILLKPRGRLQRLAPGLHQAINVLAKNGIGQHTLDLVARDRLQDNPGVVRDFPEFGIKLPPHFVGSMIPRPAQIQGQLRQGIESIDFRGPKVVCRTDCSFVHPHGSNLAKWSLGLCVWEGDLLSRQGVVQPRAAVGDHLTEQMPRRYPSTEGNEKSRHGRTPRGIRPRRLTLLTGRSAQPGYPSASLPTRSTEVFCGAG